MKQNTGFNVMLMVFLIFCVNLSLAKETTSAPGKINIINFIRLTEPRVAHITDDMLYETVVKQVELMKKHNLKGSFLLQYDALIEPRYQQLLKSLPAGSFEIGAWWELPQQLIEKAGIKWRGRYSWDYHVNVGFSIGYSLSERKAIVDVYMADFHEIFGYYPKSVASWFIDETSLDYMAQKYGIVASANCRDQIGTDGYTLWGGYWNQGYYPSKKNVYMPAQTSKNKIDVPVFRMLGSDPIRQYDMGLGGKQAQGVYTLEPASPNGGANSEWIDWYFKSFVEGASLSYAYAQVGQENSFTWGSMKVGLEKQLELIAKLRNEGKVDVETLAETGAWFKRHYKNTPPAAVTYLDDFKGDGKKTVWFNSRFYRANLLWDSGKLRFRDIHLFDETFASPYLTEKAVATSCSFYTLPFLDGFNWSDEDIVSGLRLMKIENGVAIEVTGGHPVVTDQGPGKLKVNWPTDIAGQYFEVIFDEKACTISLNGSNKDSLIWYFAFNAAKGAKLPFKQVKNKLITASFDGHNYEIGIKQGIAELSKDRPELFDLKPVGNRLILDLSKR